MDIIYILILYSILGQIISYTVDDGSETEMRCTGYKESTWRKIIYIALAVQLYFLEIYLQFKNCVFLSEYTAM